MSSGVVQSSERQLFNGDFNVGRGQLGFGFSGTITVNTPLWTLFSGANHYSVNANAVGLTVTLPVVGTATAQAQPGHWTIIYNSNATNTLTVNNSASVLVTTIGPLSSAMIVADPNVATVLWYVVYNTTNYGPNAVTLQQAYDASNGANPQIQLTTVGQGLRIRDVAGAGQLGSVFRIANSTDASTYFEQGNSVPGSQTPFVRFLTGTAASPAANNFIVGPGTSTAINSVVFSQTGLTPPVNTISNVFRRNYVGGEVFYAGNVQEGTTLTSPNERVVFGSLTTTGTAASAIDVLTAVAGTTYEVDLTIWGRDALLSSTVSVVHRLKAAISVTTGGVVTIYALSTYTSETPGYSTITSQALLSATGLVVNVTLNAPDNITGTGMVFRYKNRYSALSIL